MSAHRYDRKALRGDYWRGGAGLAFSAAALWIGGSNAFTLWLFGLCAAVFALFLIRTGLRNLTIYELTADGLNRSNAAGWRWAERRFAWDGLERFRLRFFATRRDRSQGWMELSLRGRDGALKLESTLDGFEAVLKSAVAAAEEKGVAMNETTLANLAALGIVPARTPRPE
jgi:hypothetical protein